VTAAWVEHCVIRVERYGTPFPLYSWRVWDSFGRCHEFGCERTLHDLARWGFKAGVAADVWMGRESP
jgi:hypothetical protein